MHLLLALLLLALPSTAAASLLTYDISLTKTAFQNVRQVEAGIPSLGLRVTTGPASGTIDGGFTINSDLVGPLTLADVLTFDIPFRGPLIDYSLSRVSTQVLNVDPAKGTLSGQLQDPTWFSANRLIFELTTPTPLPGFAIGYPDPGFALGPGRWLFWETDFGFRDILTGTYTVTRVPLPATGLLLLAGLVMLGRRRA